ncbi:MAG: hypothetical protein GY779_03805 [Gammaproteobacteria bacterium]|nr:hypothetical protein [Gammaproteobacteria bacterium]
MMIEIKYIWFLVFGLMLTACGGGDGSTVTPDLPKDATTITDANSYEIAQSAIAMFASVHSKSGQREAEEIAARTGDAFSMVFDRAFNKAHRLQSAASREQTTEECTYAGAVNISYHETTTTYSYSESYEDCDEGYVVFNGGFSYYQEQSNSNGDYLYDNNGSMSSTLESGTIVTEHKLEGTGNLYDGSFSYILDYSQSGATYNYLLTTTHPFSGVYADLYSGEALVEGASNTKLLITIISKYLAEVYLDDGSGVFVNKGRLVI